MAEKKLYVGTVGPFLYDDADLINDYYGDFPGETYNAFTTQGTLYAEGEPTEDNHLVRKIDLDNVEAQAYFFARIY